jgi:hypothetical protein
MKSSAIVNDMPRRAKGCEHGAGGAGSSTLTTTFATNTRAGENLEMANARQSQCYFRQSSKACIKLSISILVECGVFSASRPSPKKDTSAVSSDGFPSASAGTSQSKDCPIAQGTRALHIGRSVGSAAARVREHTTAAAPARDAMHLRGFNHFVRGNDNVCGVSSRIYAAPRERQSAHRRAGAPCESTTPRPSRV